MCSASFCIVIYVWSQIYHNFKMKNLQMILFKFVQVFCSSLQLLPFWHILAYVEWNWRRMNAVNLNVLRWFHESALNLLKREKCVYVKYEILEFKVLCFSHFMCIMINCPDCSCVTRYCGGHFYGKSCSIWFHYAAFLLQSMQQVNCI